MQEAKDRELDDALQQLARLREDAAAALRSANEREAALTADLRQCLLRSHCWGLDCSCSGTTPVLVRGA